MSIVFGDHIKIKRTNDPEIIAKGDAVFDIGLISNPEIDRFDHHQKGGAGEREKWFALCFFWFSLEEIW